jgi:hypothetical protein
MTEPTPHTFTRAQMVLLAIASFIAGVVLALFILLGN